MRSARMTIWMVTMVVMILAASPPTAAVTYQLIGLGNLPGGSGGNPKAINNNGQVGGSGWPGSGGDYAAILFDTSGSGNNINLNPGGGWSTVRGISDKEQIVGFDVDAGALLFDASGSGNNINLGGGKRAYAINNNNQIVGGSGNGPGCSAWLWDITGSTINIMFLGQGEATAINNNGQVVGNSHPTGENWRATLFNPSGGGNNINLGKLFPGDNRSFAYSINDNGQIVGLSGGPGSSHGSGYTATLFDPTGKGNNVALGIIGDSYAYAINNSAQIVGSEGGHATLFDITDSGSNIDLNTLISPALGWELKSAKCINDNGWIAGVGINPQGYSETFLLVPEPATLLLLGLGAVMLRRKL